MFAVFIISFFLFSLIWLVISASKERAVETLQARDE